MSKLIIRVNYEPELLQGNLDFALDGVIKNVNPFTSCFFFVFDIISPNNT